MANSHNIMFVISTQVIAYKSRRNFNVLKYFMFHTEDMLNNMYIYIFPCIHNLIVIISNLQSIFTQIKMFLAPLYRLFVKFSVQQNVLKLNCNRSTKPITFIQVYLFFGSLYYMYQNTFYHLYVVLWIIQIVVSKQFIQIKIIQSIVQLSIIKINISELNHQ